MVKKLEQVAGQLAARAPRRFGARELGFAAGILVALLVAGWCLFGGGSRVETENAYIKADKIALAPEVSGVISIVAVRPNQPVKRGELLLKLDQTPFQLAVNEAEAHLAQVRNQLLARRAEYAEAEAAVEQARKDAEFYRRQLERNEKLRRDTISEAQLDEARQKLEHARSLIAINTEKLSSLRAELGGNPLLPLEEQADLKVAQAKLDKARYQLSRTEITAPTDGVIANDVPQAGEMAPAGVSLISMLGGEGMWVEANLKETELARVRAGQQAEVTLDAYPGFTWQAQVDSLSPASGSEFALIPPQNASGNWVKVVQRVPVRLRLYPAKEAPTLRAGMSAQVTIDTSEDDKLVSARVAGGEGGRVVLSE
ncbi:HlyD family secretion protein [Microbulbifer yueqingensis]|uniref:Membrane fusion protein, multidrug efflux system n=1 Tax=Microbulbifer yueqingensis TaxID=658219 RepID=A0A1G8Y449_9GAMM|nr:HlyD family secretion protein [Microbulbifer yueqingensis]SDJ97618.1 membrane fusion protein, multidrug efflux system [Microbulbifer yueqingensis]